jgi:hypothetical protein
MTPDGRTGVTEGRENSFALAGGAGVYYPPSVRPGAAPFSRDFSLRVPEKE